MVIGSSGDRVVCDRDRVMMGSDNRVLARLR